MSAGRRTGMLARSSFLRLLSAGVTLSFVGMPSLVRAQADYRLGTGDKIKVTVFGEEDASGEYEVDASGAISARLLGRLQVKGMTVSELENMMIEQFGGRGYLKHPRVAIELINLRPFFILGEVEKRGSYPYVNGLTVAQAVAIAGGYTYRASRKSITIQRVGAPREVPAQENDQVFPGDIIRVPERFF